MSVPGGSEGSTITVRGRKGTMSVRSGAQVTSVLSTEQIQRTGEGNIAGALNRVTGLSLVGGGYVYVRGLGDRYSLALLNGSPLPSPEPLKRVVPLDLFPTNVVASALVQKSYSVNFPGEFGGGVINLTTRAIPTEAFLTIGGGISGDTETTGNLGYTYYGSKSDWTGYDNGNRDIPSEMAAYLASGDRISSGTVDTKKIASQLVNGRNALVQRWPELPVNFTASISAGKPFELENGATLGVIAAAGYSNKWTTRDSVNQNSLSSDLADIESNFQRVTTDNRVVTNGLFGLSLVNGDTKIRWTNFYVHDTIKHTRLSLGQRHGTNVDYMQQDTAWYERQLANTQVVGEFKPTDKLSLNARASYAETKRESPGELFFEYARTNADADLFGKYFVNRLNNGNSGDATISYSDLNERLMSGSFDARYKLTPGIALSAGIDLTDTRRESSRRDFQFQAPNTFPGGVDMFRPDYLLEPAVINNFGVVMIETNEGNPAFLATLKTDAAFLKLDGDLSDAWKFDAGLRYEHAKQDVSPVQVFTTPGASLAATHLDENYILPAATLTWQVNADAQLRINASKTLARPQFRELIYQFYFDPESNRAYRGNPLLVDSQLTNAEVRYEWYFAPGQRATIAGFVKQIENPIESYVSGDDFTTSFANAPKADLYGFEAEVLKYYEIPAWLPGHGGELWNDRRIIASANYTYSKSSLSVDEDDKTYAFAVSSTRATDFFRDGSPMTGQSEHIANIELGIESQDHLSQQTLMINYASKRATSRGLANSGQPDIFEYPGLRVDFVARQGVTVHGRELEVKFEARNLTGQKYEEYQKSGDNRVDINSYKLGTVFSLSLQSKF
ncbi:TonB-denpendent receptor [Asticcacaulis sp. AC460]|uniref:TonB-dependent receptor domain-containing protein n=1 Tax=Asticcacaulis sp. AC460 TaxID=1282360 RepID=UPI0003C3F7FC|nr:TonB-dependent receptor [Asticcacaulis sp. AC460]ESQ91198.1 TonB-denpendent receptor [Asticcacaulis sp. AC460]